MGILTKALQGNKTFRDKYKEAETKTEKEKLDYIVGNMKILQAGGFGVLVCMQCKGDFYTKDKELALELRKYMHTNVCGNPCKKKFKYNKDKNCIEKVI